MIPGLQSKCSDSVVASAATIFVLTDICRVSGSTQIDTILSPLQGSGVTIVLIPTDGAVVLSAAGNVLVGITMTQNRAVALYWSRATGKWYIDNGV